MTKQVEVESHEVVHRGFYPKSVIRLRHSRFDGSWSPVVQRDMIEIGRCAVLLPYDPVTDRVLLIEQFRPATYVMNASGWVIETVAGRVEPGETPLAAGRREALEEGGVTVTDVETITEAFASPGCSTELTTLMVGRADLASAGGVHGAPGEDEDIAVVTLAFDEAMDWAAEGRIHGLPVLTALYWLALHRSELRARWS